MRNSDFLFIVGRGGGLLLLLLLLLFLSKFVVVNIWCMSVFNCLDFKMSCYRTCLLIGSGKRNQEGWFYSFIFFYLYYFTGIEITKLAHWRLNIVHDEKIINLRWLTFKMSILKTWDHSLTSTPWQLIGPTMYTKKKT